MTDIPLTWSNSTVANATSERIGDDLIFPMNDGVTDMPTVWVVAWLAILGLVLVCMFVLLRKIVCCCKRQQVYSPVPVTEGTVTLAAGPARGFAKDEPISGMAT